MTKNRTDWVKVFFSLIMGFLLGIVHCIYIFTELRYYGIFVTITMFGIIWGVLTFANAYLFYKGVDFIEKKLF